jgi:hypothetical protein
MMIAESADEGASHRNSCLNCLPYAHHDDSGIILMRVASTFDGGYQRFGDGIGAVGRARRYGAQDIIGLERLNTIAC